MLLLSVVSMISRKGAHEMDVEQRLREAGLAPRRLPAMLTVIPS